MIFMTIQNVFQCLLKIVSIMFLNYSKSLGKMEESVTFL